MISISVAQTAIASTRTRTSAGPGSGTGFSMSDSSSGPPSTHAFMRSGMGYWLLRKREPTTDITMFHFQFTGDILGSSVLSRSATYWVALLLLSCIRPFPRNRFPCPLTAIPEPAYSISKAAWTVATWSFTYETPDPAVACSRTDAGFLPVSPHAAGERLCAAHIRLTLRFALSHVSTPLHVIYVLERED